MRKKWFELVAVAIALVGTSIGFWVQFSQRRERDLNALTAMYTLKENEDQLKKLQANIDEIVSKKISEAPRISVDAASLDARFKDIDKKITSVGEQTLAVRQAINPLKPDEVLTIARLTDEVKALDKDFGDLKQELSAQQKDFQESVVREIKVSSDSTGLILVVLIPLVLNFLYTVWKDFRKGREAGNES